MPKPKNAPDKKSQPQAKKDKHPRLHQHSGHQKGNQGSRLARVLAMLGDCPRLKSLSRYLRGLDQGAGRGRGVGGAFGWPDDSGEVA